MKITKVDKDGRTISSEFVTRKDAETILQTAKSRDLSRQGQNEVPGGSEQRSAPAAIVTSRPADMQQINRDIAQKSAFEKQLATQRVSDQKYAVFLDIMRWLPKSRAFL